jgi:hypothetical protein
MTTVDELIDEAGWARVTLHHNDGVVIHTDWGQLNYFDGDTGLITFTDADDEQPSLRFHKKNIVSINPTDENPDCESVVVDYRNTYTGEAMFDRVEFPQDPSDKDYNYVNVIMRNGEQISVFLTDMETWIVQVTHNFEEIHHEEHSILMATPIVLIDPVAKYIPIEED